MNIVPMHLEENKDDNERRRHVYSKYHPALLNNIIWETSVEEGGNYFCNTQLTFSCNGQFKLYVYSLQETLIHLR